MAKMGMEPREAYHTNKKASKPASEKGESKKYESSEHPKPKLGSGERFAALSGSLKKQGVSNPDALAASIGRKKYGAKKMALMAAAGRRKSK
jgi:hypothetical protein